MKKSEKKTLAKSLLNGALSFVKNATVANPVVSMGVGAAQGIVKSVQDAKDKNLASETGGVGKVDYAGLIGAITGAVIVIGGGIALVMGWLTVEDLKALVKIWESTQ